ncbi:conserved exported hypothetical protein [Luteimonas sp. 9C]|uniref:M16 family metallopeptidase n=1 Tax=Luteimonas sp. 9C TaxID=2653148 RepID=UPI0012F27B98|nr:pitrilysin family protein [Luteimonas sp. 9C]VXB06622.1 conserved exported hypothetical protein [Luteimonas sp. 9C]
MQRRLRACVVVWLLGAAGTLWAAPPQLDAPVHEAEGIREYRFDNGLALVLFPDASKPVTTVNVTYRVGSRHEGYGETGMAHLLEHLVFKGTPTHADIPGEMRRRGVRFNGTTWLDRTNYFASFSTDADTLDWVLRMEADRMVNSHIARADLDSEMTVVRNEMEAGENNPVRALVQRVMGAAYQWHNYGNSTIGARSDVENVPIDRLQAFYRTWYQPDNAVLVIAGDFDPAQALAAVGASFGALPKPERALPATYTREPAQDGERHVVVRRVGRTPYLVAGYHIPAGRHDDSAAVAVLSQVLGSTPGGRLHRALVESGRATGASASALAMNEPSYLTFVAEAPEGSDLDALQTDLLALVEDAAATPFTDAEVDDAKQRMLAGYARALRDPNAVGVALSEAIAQGDWRLLLRTRDRIEAVTVADVARVAQAYLRRDNRTTGQFLPTDAVERVTVPEAPTADAALADFVPRAALDAGEAFDPSYANIDARTRISTLSNGAKLAVLDKTTRGNSVQVRMHLRLGDAQRLHDRAIAGQTAGALLMRGSAGYDRAALSRQLTSLRSTLSVGGTATTVTVAATTDRAHVAALLDLVADVLRRPTFPDSEFAQLRSQQLTGIRGSMSEPGAVANEALSQHFNAFPAGHPYAATTFDERIARIEALRLDEVRAFHRDFYGMGEGATIAVVGDVDPDAVRTQLEALFGDWALPTPFTRIETPYLARAAVHETLRTPDKANATLIARHALRMRQDHPDFPALLVGNYIFGGSGMKSRLGDRIRQREGLSYGVGSNFSASVFDEAGAFGVSAIAAPENMAQVETAMREELQRIRSEGIRQSELDDALDGMLRARRTSRANDPELVGMLDSNLYTGRDMAYSSAFEDKLRALTPEAVRAAMARHLQPEALSVFIGGDFKD